MESADIITAAFPELTEDQRRQFAALGELYAEWNSRINVISRKDIDNLYTKHVLHSLALARLWGPLAPSTTILDIGTGGGFPGIPLAIMYPECRFHLIDRIGKKNPRCLGSGRRRRACQRELSARRHRRMPRTLRLRGLARGDAP